MLSNETHYFKCQHKISVIPREMIRYKMACVLKTIARTRAPNEELKGLVCHNHENN